MPFSKRYLITTTLTLLLLGGAALVGVVASTVWLTQRAEDFSEIVNRQNRIRATALGLRESLMAAESSQRGFVLTNNEIYLAPYETSAGAAAVQIQNLRTELARTERFGRMFPILAALVQRKMQDMQNVIDLKKAGSSADYSAIIATNEGKALMDEAQVFLSAIILDADEALASGLREQTTSIFALRIGTSIAALLILFVVGGVVVTFVRYSRELAEARDELATANTGLEHKVAQRTSDLAQARDRAEVLLAEVNHRVANSLAFVGALINLQRQAMKDPAAREALDETRSRIQAVAEIHKHLYTSGDVTSVALDEYMEALLKELERTLASQGHGSSISHQIEPIRMATTACINLGIVVTEWVTNAFKYAYADGGGEVRVRAAKVEDRLHVAVEDDGVGMSGGSVPQGTGVGSKIVATIARSLKSEISYHNRSPGTEARLVMPLAAA
jgi:two-component sensor histidine kinase/CHASE3 domain sensor protein